MNEKIRLSNRLEKVAAFLPKGANFADIGSDHAYLPCYVCLLDETSQAIAGEVNEGPYNSAKETVKLYQLYNVVDVRLGDGLQVLKNSEVQQLVIAGMGGSLIRTILENGKDKLDRVERIIAQPNVDARSVRKWMRENGYTFVAEELIEENGHFYEIIVADIAKNVNERTITEKELLFGPLLLQSKPTAFFHKWKHELDKLNYVLEQMKHASVPDNEKITKFQTELDWIREVLHYDKNIT